MIALGEDPDIHHVPVTREEEGIGICAGAYLDGKRPAMVMMNAGFVLSANALQRSVATDFLDPRKSRVVREASLIKPGASLAPWEHTDIKRRAEGFRLA